jgi:hypothetical protein
MEKKYLSVAAISFLIAFPVTLVGSYVLLLLRNLISPLPIIIDVYLSAGTFWVTAKMAAIMTLVFMVYNLSVEARR